MKYSKSLLLYQEQPAYGLLLKIILPLVPLLMLGTALYLELTGEEAGALFLTGEAFLVAFIFWMVFPRKYRVYEDHLSIALGGPLAVNIGFDRIASIEVTSRPAFTANFVTRVASTYVLIARKRGISIAITPKSYDSFVQNANLALSEWKRTRPSSPSGRNP